jgi:hypothetical protein
MNKEHPIVERLRRAGYGESSSGEIDIEGAFKALGIRLGKTSTSPKLKKHFEEIRRMMSSRGRLGGVSGIVNLEYQKKSKFIFPNPTVRGFENTAKVQLTLDQAIMNKIAQQLNDIKDAYIDEMLTTIAEKTPVDTGRAKSGWIRNGDDIVNPVPYVPYLESGTDRMRPIGMVSSTMANGQRILDLIVSRFLE